ncbi:hypothetical protein SAMN05421819_0156 [Bryocella elongata]|uniref:Uncharacterized protein n=1 Tax=Bryocella elongata TaxID=863522 RepID=A0A1H5SFD0_9BACT|nr:hypothetical protein [Bryocella elongata]SEF48511.1 hypothetical protein SAMN05421819_0156 [Bryocella elongata]
MVMLMLSCAIAVSLALGVLFAYGLCLGLFRLFRWHSISAARERMQSAGTRIAIEG